MFLILLPYRTFFKRNPFFNLSNIEQFRTIENNPHHWLTTDILQIHHFQYQFFQNLTLNTKTKEQIQIYPLFLRKFFKHNYQLVWHSKFQDACINFPQQFSPLMNFYLFLLILIANTNNIIISLIFHPLIFNTLPMTPIVLIKVLTFLLLIVLIPNNLTYLPQLIQLPTSLFKLFLHLQML